MRTAHLVEHLTPFNPAYNETIQRNAQTLLGLGHAAATSTATGMIDQTLRAHAQVLAYSDVFMFCAAAAFCAVPFAFLFSNVKASDGVGVGYKNR